MKRAAELYGVIGHPVLHSKSPEVMKELFRLSGKSVIYLRIGSDPARPQHALHTAKTLGLRGANVTSPFKESLASSVELRDEARTLNATNTLLFSAEQIFGYNTDVQGVKKSLPRPPKRVAVLGAGGAARAALLAIKESASEVFVVNRTWERAELVAAQFNGVAIAVEDSRLSEIVSSCDTIISCLPPEAQLLPQEAFRCGQLLLDASYKSESRTTVLARAAGCTIVTGYSWLYHQAARSFELFTQGVAPLLGVEELGCSAPLSKRGVALIGLPGVGKSAVSETLSSIYEVISTDNLIESAELSSVPEIFQNQGEDYFRSLERRVVQQITPGYQTLLDCGGGVVNNKDNREHLARNFYVVWLVADLNSIRERLASQTTAVRPLLADENGLEKLWRERFSLYAEMSDLVIGTDGIEPGEVGKLIRSELRAVGR